MQTQCPAQRPNYTSQWIQMLPFFSRNQSSSSSPSPLIPPSVAAARRRWTRCICAGYLLSILLNICSTAVVVTRLQSAAKATDQEQMECNKEFMECFGKWETDRGSHTGESNGRSPHPNAPPIAIHMSFDSFANNKTGAEIAQARLSADDLLQNVTGWGSTPNKYFGQAIDYDETTGELSISETGVYQVYSQLTFKGPQCGDCLKQFEQKLQDEEGNTLLTDTAYKVCRYARNNYTPCHTSSMFSTILLHEHRRIQIKAKPINLLRKDKLSFFGIFKLD